LSITNWKAADGFRPHHLSLLFILLFSSLMKWRTIMNVSLIIPAFNEQARISATLEQYSQCLNVHYHDAYEIIVVANGCTDQTVNVALQFASSCSQVKVIDIPEPVGNGAAVLEGFRRANGKYIAFADADCATSPESLIGLIEQLKDVDIVIGSRWLPASQVIKKQPFLRRIFSRLFNLSVHILFQLPYRDTQCGAKAFLAAPAKALSKVVKESSWTFDVDLLLWAKYYHFEVKEAPVVWEDQEGSKIHFQAIFREVLGSLWSLKHSNNLQKAFEKSSPVPVEELS
jgi:glycosyltransferase involved in cell wall biosynthesis